MSLAVERASPQHGLGVEHELRSSAYLGARKIRVVDEEQYEIGCVKLVSVASHTRSKVIEIDMCRNVVVVYT